jgi:multidrug transporter EmrE-like cation transporter
MTNALLVATVIVFTVFSQLILKVGQHTFYYPRNFGASELLKMSAINLSNFYVVVCILLTLLAGLAWLLVIQNMPLSRAYPLMSLNYVTIYLLSWVFFSESLSIPSAIGMVFIVIGTSLLGFK